MMGQTIQVQVTQSEKNRIAQANAPPPVPTGPTRLYVGSLNSNITEGDLRDLLDTYGPIENITLLKDSETNKSKGFGFVKFRRADDAARALKHLNGKEVAGKQIKCVLVNETQKVGGKDTPTGMFELDDEDGGVSLNTASRLQLMEKLQRGDEMPTPAVQAPPKAASKPKEVAPAPSFPKNPPSPCIKITNMFDPAGESDPNWQQEIQEDVSDECRKFGSVVHCYVDKESQGHVYLKFGSIPAAQNAINALDKRWFAGRQVTAEFVSERLYYGRFPEAKNR
jgi:RNA-binding protein 39